MNEVAKYLLRAHIVETRRSAELARQIPSNLLDSQLPNSLSIKNQLLDLGDTRQRVAFQMQNINYPFVMRPDPQVVQPEGISIYILLSGVLFIKAARGISDHNLISIYFGDQEYDFIGAIDALNKHDYMHYGQILSWAGVNRIRLPFYEKLYGVQFPPNV